VDDPPIDPLGSAPGCGCCLAAKRVFSNGVIQWCTALQTGGVMPWAENSVSLQDQSAPCW
jgi:hypothetical protein